MNGADTPEYWVFDFAVPLGAAFELEGGLVEHAPRSATGRRRRGWRVGFRRLDYFTRKLDFMESAIRKQLTPQANVIARLCTIPGVEVTTAWTIIAEMGLDMGVFPDGDHAANWSGGVSGESGDGQQAAERTDAQGEPLSAPGPGADGVGHLTPQGS